MAERQEQLIFMMLSGYESTPNLAVFGNGGIQVDHEVFDASDPEGHAALGRALVSNAQAWRKCHVEVNPNPPPVVDMSAFNGATALPKTIFIELQGPCPITAAKQAELDANAITDEQIDAMEAANGLG